MRWDYGPVFGPEYPSLKLLSQYQVLWFSFLWLKQDAIIWFECVPGPVNIFLCSWVTHNMILISDEGIGDESLLARTDLCWSCKMVCPWGPFPSHPLFTLCSSGPPDCARFPVLHALHLVHHILIYLKPNPTGLLPHSLTPCNLSGNPSMNPNAILCLLVPMLHSLAKIFILLFGNNALSWGNHVRVEILSFALASRTGRQKESGWRHS